MHKNRKKRIISCLLSTVLVFLSIFGILAENLIGVKAGEDPIRIVGGNSMNNAAKTQCDTLYVDDVSAEGEEDWFSFTTPDYECYTKVYAYNATIGSNRYNSDLFRMYIYTNEKVKKGNFDLGTGVSSTIYLKLTPNTTYYMQVYSGDNYTGQYQFSYTFLPDPDGDTMEEATAISPDINYAKDLESGEDVDWFSFTTPDYECYTKVYAYNATIGSNSYNSDLFRMYIYTNEKVKKGNFDLGTGVSSTIYLKLTPNTAYYMQVYSGDNYTGQYQFSYTFLPDPDGDIMEEATAIGLNTSYDKTLDADKDVDYFKVDILASGAYSFYLRNRNIGKDTSLTVYNKYKETLLTVTAGKQAEDTKAVELEAGQTYYIACQNEKGNLGDYCIKVLPPDNVVLKNLGECTISLEYSSVKYTGAAFTPKVTLRDGSNVLVEGTNYEVKYYNNVNVGTATVSVTGKGIYSGTVNRTFTITSAGEIEEPDTEDLTKPSERPTEPITQDPTTEESTTEEPSTEKPTTEQPSTEELTTEQPKVYTVTFKDGNDVLSVQKVESGMSAKAPVVMEKEGYRLSWDKSFARIKEDTVVNAVWTEIKPVNVTIHFKNTCNWDNVGIWIYEGVGWTRNICPKDACPAYHTSTDPKINSHPIWPGAKMEAEKNYDGWYTITVPFEDTSAGAVMIFNNLVADTDPDDPNSDAEDKAILEGLGLVMDTKAKQQTPNQIVTPNLFVNGTKEFWCDFDGDIKGYTGKLTATKPSSYKNTPDIEEPTEKPTDDSVLHNPVIVKDSTMDAGQKVTWDCVWFGSYPQTEVKETDNEYALLQKTDGWDNNGDAVINGKKYRRMRKGDAIHVTSGNISYYDREDDTAYHYFRYEPVKWRVLKTDESRAMLLSDIILDDRKYNTENSTTTWEISTIRSWLNGYNGGMNQEGTDYSSSNFMDSAFTDGEQSAIKNTNVVNSDNLYYGTEGGNDTIDKLFLLSESEIYNDNAVTCGFVSGRDTYDEARRCKSSDYAKAMGVYSSTLTDYKDNCWWWLRSPGCSSNFATYADYYGDVNFIGNNVYYDSYGVRVALNLNLSSSNLYTYAGTVCSDGTVNVTGEPTIQEPDIEKPGTEEPSTEETTTEQPPVKKTQTLKVTKSYTKTYGAKAFKLYAKLTKGNGTLKYTTSNKKVAAVDKNGRVTIKGTGICTITVTASATDTYKSASAKITITVKPKKNAISKIKASGSRMLSVTWKKDTKCSGYELQYSTTKNFARKTTVTVNIGKNKTTSYKIRKLAKGKKYYICIRAYQNVKVNGKTKKLCGDWSSVRQSGKVK